MDQVQVINLGTPTTGRNEKVLRQCPLCERCRDCGYTHVGIECPDPDPGFDGTCLCDPKLRTVA